MKKLRRHFIVVVCFLFITGYVYCEEELNEKNIINVPEENFIKERNPFDLSAELIEKSMSEQYVSFTGEGLNRFNLPRIEITGVMVVGNETMATAKIEQLGTVTLGPDERIVFPGRGGNSFSSFIIKKITPSEMVILVEGGYEIKGRFR